jgi:hypothetical protein
MANTVDNDEPTETDDEGLLKGKRRTLMKAAAGAIGASVGGSAVMGSAAAAPGDNGPFQLDFVHGHNVKDPLDSTGYAGDTSNDAGSSGRLIRWIWSDQDQNENEGSDTKYQPFTDSRIGCDVTPTGPISIDYAAGTATIEFDIENCDPSTWDSNLDYPLALYSYGAPDGENGWDPTKADQQFLYDESRIRFNSTGTKTITVDIPYLEPPIGVNFDDFGPRDPSTLAGVEYINAKPGDHGNGGVNRESALYTGLTTFVPDSTFPQGGFVNPGTDFANVRNKFEDYLLETHITAAGMDFIGVDTFVKSGTYDLILNVCEVNSNFQSSGNRVFDVVVEGNTEITDYDLYADGGYRESNEITITNVNVSNNFLRFRLNKKPASSEDLILGGYRIEPSS